ncbi:MAG TPA: potassium-transporting ATPase subunit C [Tepidisphaeraceae bacterium]|jgi:K+-transporting ATPase ATPase C chain|nr:potassium-transporting ATPase subunit C [Tepidisphaeraceae bacterium]
MTDKTPDFPAHDSNSNDQPGGNLLRHIWASIGATIILGVICCGIYPFVIWGLGQLMFPVQANGSLLKKDGTFTTKDDEAIGSALIGQNFSAPQYFHPRPSAAGNGYDPTSSGGSNLGPLSDKLINGATNPATTQPTAQPETLAFDGVRLRTIHYAMDNGISFKLYMVSTDGSRTDADLKDYLNTDGAPNDVKLVDAFPHRGATAGLIAADFGVLIPGDAVTASGSGLDPHISPANAELQINRVASARHIDADQVRALIKQYTDGPDLGIIGDPGVNVLRLNLALDAKYPMQASK